MPKRSKIDRITVTEKVFNQPVAPGYIRMIHFVKNYMDGLSIRPQDREFFALAFLKILNGAEPEKALEIKTQKRGNRKSLENEILFLEIAVYFASKRLAGLTWDKAAEVAMKEYQRSKTTVERCYKLNRQVADDIAKMQKTLPNPVGPNSFFSS